MMRRNGWLLALVFVACLSGAGLAVTTASRCPEPARASADLQTLLQAVGPLDADERQALAARRAVFLRQQALIAERLRVANAELAEAVAHDPRWSPHIEAVIAQVENADDQLQRETLVYIFEVRAGLKPAHRPAYDRALIAALQRGSR